MRGGPSAVYAPYPMAAVAAVAAVPEARATTRLMNIRRESGSRSAEAGTGKSGPDYGTSAVSPTERLRRARISKGRNAPRQPARASGTW